MPSKAWLVNRYICLETGVHKQYLPEQSVVAFNHTVRFYTLKQNNNFDVTKLLI